MIKSIAELGTKADYVKRLKSAAAKVNARPTPCHVCKSFKFGDGTKGPVALMGVVPAAVLSALKKRGTFASGTCRKNSGGDIECAGVDATVCALALRWAGVMIEAVHADARGDDGRTRDGDTGMIAKPLPEKYKDEDKKLGWRTANPALKDLEVVTTEYFGDEKRARSKVEFDEKGRMSDGEGEEIESERLGYVVNPKDKALHIFKSKHTEKDGKRKNTHHSSPLSGGEVAAAGELITDSSGRLAAISDKSGHYKPDAKMTFEAVRELAKEKDKDGYAVNLTRRGKKDPVRMTPQEKQGIDPGEARNARAPGNRSATVMLVGKNGITAEGYAACKGDVNRLNALIQKFAPKVKLTAKDLRENPGVEAINLLIGHRTSVTLSAEQFLQTEGNEAQIRVKKTLNQEIKLQGAAPDVEKNTTGAPSRERSVSEQAAVDAIEAKVKGGPGKLDVQKFAKHTGIARDKAKQQDLPDPAPRKPVRDKAAQRPLDDVAPQTPVPPKPANAYAEVELVPEKDSKGGGRPANAYGEVGGKAAKKGKEKLK